MTAEPTMIAGVALLAIAGGFWLNEYLSQGCDGHHWDDGYWLHPVADSVTGASVRSVGPLSKKELLIRRERKYTCEDCGETKIKEQTWKQIEEGELLDVSENER